MECVTSQIDVELSVLMLVCWCLTVESGQKLSSHEILRLSEDLKTKQVKLDELESGDKGLAKLWANLSEISQKVRHTLISVFVSCCSDLKHVKMI